MSVVEAVLIIQRHERARQGRLRAKIMQENRLKEEAEKNSDLGVKSALTSEDAAIIIQKVEKQLCFNKFSIGEDI